MGKKALVVWGIIGVLVAAILFSFWQRQHLAIELITGGFGTQYKDAPYPFNNPSYKVRCHDDSTNTYQLKYVELKVQQGQTELKIPADAIADVYKRADAKTCVPVEIRLIYTFYKGKLLRDGKEKSKFGWSEAIRAGYKASADDPWPTVRIKIIDLLDSPQEMRKKMAPWRQADAKTYSTRFKMKHYPLWLYPYAKHKFYEYEFYRDNSRDKEFVGPVDMYLWGVEGSHNPINHQPRLVGCHFGTGLLITTPDSDETRNRFINITPDKRSGGCGGTYYVETDDTILELEVDISRDGVLVIDKIYAQIDGIIKSYIVPPSSTTTTDDTP